MAVLALDVGSKRIGVAVADPTGSFALPLTVIQRTNVASDLAEILELAQSYGADELVVGDPVDLSGVRGIASANMDRFVENLARVYAGTIHRADERLTTAQATKSLIAAHLSRRKRKTVVDQVAATLILEGFLARRRAQS